MQGQILLQDTKSLFSNGLEPIIPGSPHSSRADMALVEHDWGDESGKSPEQAVHSQHESQTSSQRDDAVLERLGKSPQLKV